MILIDISLGHKNELGSRQNLCGCENIYTSERILAVGLVKIRSQKNIITGMKINVIKTTKFCTLSRFADESHQLYENDRVQNDQILYLVEIHRRISSLVYK
jgi:hypothetical protein